MSDPALGNLLSSGPSAAMTGGVSGAQDPDAPKALNQLQPDAQAKGILKLWFDQEPYYKRLRALWKVNALRHAGQTGIYLIKRTDTQEWQAYAPPGSAKQTPSLNKAARLCRLLRAILFTDPPEPEATPSSDSDEDRDAAEFSTRALIDLGNEGNLDNAHSAEQAFDAASIYGSGYRRYYVEPQGGGLRPWDVEATATATAYDPADPQSSLRDPATGQPAPPYVRKFVRRDFTLTDNARDPAIQRIWVPKLCREVLKAPHVRFLPATAADIWEAQGVLVGAFATLDDLRSRFPGRIPTEPERLQKLISYRPQETGELLPGGKSTRQTVLERDKTPSGDTLVFTVTCYYRQGPSYPMGYYGVAAGEDQLLFAGNWYNEQKGEPLDLPLDQFKQVDDESSGHGLGMMTFVGPGNEIRAGTLGSMLEHLDRFLNRKVFYPYHSPIQPRSAQALTGTYIPIPIGGEPKVEQVPDFPAAAMEMFNLISGELDHEAGLEPPVSGQNPPSVESGLHARTIIEQVNVGLSDLRNNVIRGLVRGWRIQLQQVAWKYTVPQQIGWVGDDGAFKQREWTGTDLGNTKDVMLHKGTLSMLAPSAKLAVAQQMATMTVGNEPLLKAEDLRRIVIGNVGALLGLQDDPRRLRIRRQIGLWAEGPPTGWRPAPAPQALPGQPAPPPAPPDPVLARIWAPLPVDDQQDVALIRLSELGRLMSSTKYSRWIPEWRAAVDAEYQRARHAAGVATVAEQQQAQQAAAQAQQAQQQDAAAKLTPIITQTQQAVQQLAQELRSQTAALGTAVKQVQTEVQTVSKAVANVTDDVEAVTHGVDQQLAEQARTLEAGLADARKALDDRLVQLAQTLRPGEPVPPAPSEPSVTHVHVGGPGEAEFEVTARDEAGRAKKVRRIPKKPPEPPPAAPEEVP